jgi:hypothetical protein
MLREEAKDREASEPEYKIAAKNSSIYTITESAALMLF